MLCFSAINIFKRKDIGQENLFTYALVNLFITLSMSSKISTKHNRELLQVCVYPEYILMGLSDVHKIITD